MTDEMASQSASSNPLRASLYPRRHLIHSFDRQIEEVRRWFPRIDPDTAWRRTKGQFSEQSAPAHSEGLFCFVQPRFFGSRETGVREMLGALREQRRGHFRSYLDGKLDPGHLRVRGKTQRLLTRVALDQPGDIWIAYAQFGLFRQGKPTVVHPLENEFNLDILSVANMILTHPRRFVHNTDLHAHCGGEAFRPHITTLPRAIKQKAAFSYTPFFQYHDGKLRFDSFMTETEFSQDGAVTAFYPT